MNSTCSFVDCSTQPSDSIFGKGRLFENKEKQKRAILYKNERAAVIPNLSRSGPRSIQFFRFLQSIKVGSQLGVGSRSLQGASQSIFFVSFRCPLTVVRQSAASSIFCCCRGTPSHSGSSAAPRAAGCEAGRQRLGLAAGAPRLLRQPRTGIAPRRTLAPRRTMILSTY